ncbi:hypothetical protein J6590_013513 [Homalodisca vitripennis]|nr:hypothetical protein J6590_013513 [Homalodisca vitripennis]
MEFDYNKHLDVSCPCSVKYPRAKACVPPRTSILLRALGSIITFRTVSLIVGYFTNSLHSVSAGPDFYRYSTCRCPVRVLSNILEPRHAFLPGHQSCYGALGSIITFRTVSLIVGYFTNSLHSVSAGPDFYRYSTCRCPVRVLSNILEPRHAFLHGHQSCYGALGSIITFRTVSLIVGYFTNSLHSVSAGPDFYRYSTCRCPVRVLSNILEPRHAFLHGHQSCYGALGSIITFRTVSLIVGYFTNSLHSVSAGPDFYRYSTCRCPVRVLSNILEPRHAFLHGHQSCYGALGSIITFRTVSLIVGYFTNSLHSVSAGPDFYRYSTCRCPVRVLSNILEPRHAFLHGHQSCYGALGSIITFRTVSLIVGYFTNSLHSVSAGPDFYRYSTCRCPVRVLSNILEPRHAFLHGHQSCYGALGSIITFRTVSLIVGYFTNSLHSVSAGPDFYRYSTCRCPVRVLSNILEPRRAHLPGHQSCYGALGSIITFRTVSLIVGYFTNSLYSVSAGPDFYRYSTCRCPVRVLSNILEPRHAHLPGHQSCYGALGSIITFRTVSLIVGYFTNSLYSVSAGPDFYRYSTCRCPVCVLSNILKPRRAHLHGHRPVFMYNNF